MNIPWPAVVIAHLREGNTKQKGLDPHIDHQSPRQDRNEITQKCCMEHEPTRNKAYISAKSQSCAGSQNLGLKLFLSWLVSG